HDRVDARPRVSDERGAARAAGGRHAVKPIALVALTLALAGCGYTEGHEVILRAPSGPTGREVEVYMEGQALTRPFYEVALLQVVGHGADANMEDVVKALTARASSLGCDAVAQLRVDQGYALAHAVGICVKYTRTAPASAAPRESPGAPPTSEPESQPESQPDSLPGSPHESAPAPTVAPPEKPAQPQ